MTKQTLRKTHNFRGGDRSVMMDLEKSYRKLIRQQNEEENLNKNLPLLKKNWLRRVRREDTMVNISNFRLISKFCLTR